MRRIALVYDPAFLRHRPSGAHPEGPERLRAIVSALKSASLWDSFIQLRPRNADISELTRAHDPGYVARLLALRGHGLLDPDTYYGPESPDVAVRASGGAISLVEEVLSGRAEGGLGLLRPPGHHASARQAMGFCLFNHIAVAAHHALAAYGLERVFIFDPDVHHGNGTADIFREDPRVLYVSLHQSPWYPGTGFPEDTGDFPAQGMTAHAALPAGSTDADYLSVMAEVVLPLARAFAPQLILISAGFDAHRDDPLGEMHLTTLGFSHIFAQLVPLAPCVALLEGGYEPVSLGEGVVALAQALMEPERPLPPVGGEVRHDVREAVQKLQIALAPDWPQLFTT